MDGNYPSVLHDRLVELLRASGRNTLRVAQVATILGVSDDESQYGALRELLAHSRFVNYDEARQTVRSELPEHVDQEDEDEAALLALSDVDGRGRHGAATTGQVRLHQRRSNSRQAPRHGSRGNAGAAAAGGVGGYGGYRSDTGPAGASSNNRSFVGPSRRRAPGEWSKPSQRALDDAASYPGPVGRVGYVCVADELHLGKLEAYYHAQGYYTKFDFDVLHVRFAQPPSARAVRVETDAAATSHTANNAERNDDTVARCSGGNNHNNNNSSSSSHHSPGVSVLPPSPPTSSYPQGVRAAADASPTHRDYGSTRSDAKAAGAGASGVASSVEGGEAPAASSNSNGNSNNNNTSTNASVKHGFDLFIFPYGAVVWWGFDQRYFKIVESDYMLPHSAISHCMTNRYTTQLVNENYPVWCTYNLVRRDTLEVDDDFKARLRFDHFVIPYSRGEMGTGSVLMLCASHALAQSAKIDYIELQVQDLADSCSPLPRELREKGTVSITERRLLQLRGEVLSYRLMLKSGSDLLDEPDFFWENAYLKPVFQATKEEFEIAERVEALDNKLDAANEMLSMLAEDFSQRHGARLEWIVIWLVFVEVVIGVLELLVDIRPWMRAK